MLLPLNDDRRKSLVLAAILEIPFLLAMILTPEGRWPRIELALWLFHGVPSVLVVLIKVLIWGHGGPDQMQAWMFAVLYIGQVAVLSIPIHLLLEVADRSRDGRRGK